ncbi:MAG TPA: TonB family protein [Vineibacter sp.]|nr:TonB family protein [Vineibacter sp.]
MVLAAHLAGAAALFAWRAPQDAAPTAPAILIELAVSAAVPSPDISNDAPGPRQDAAVPRPSEPPPTDVEASALTSPEPRPSEPSKLPERDPLSLHIPPPDRLPEVALPPPEKRRPPNKRPSLAATPTPLPKPAPREPDSDRRPMAMQTTAPPPASESTSHAGVAAPGAANQPSPDTVSRWQTAILAHLQKHKRYPAASRAADQQGTAYLRFAIDRNGRVLAMQVERPSGYSTLDQETLDLVERAQPLPAPPSDMSGERFEFIVPVKFQLR